MKWFSVEEKLPPENEYIFLEVTHKSFPLQELNPPREPENLVKLKTVGKCRYLTGKIREYRLDVVISEPILTFLIIDLFDSDEKIHKNKKGLLVGSSKKNMEYLSEITGFHEEKLVTVSKWAYSTEIINKSITPRNKKI